MFSTIGFQLLFDDVSCVDTESKLHSDAPIVIVDEVTEPGCVDDRQMETNTIFLDVCGYTETFSHKKAQQEKAYRRQYSQSRRF
jgi:hypothetical protein